MHKYYNKWSFPGYKISISKFGFMIVMYDCVYQNIFTTSKQTYLLSLSKFLAQQTKFAIYSNFNASGEYEVSAYHDQTCPSSNFFCFFFFLLSPLVCCPSVRWEEYRARISNNLFFASRNGASDFASINCWTKRKWVST